MPVLEPMKIDERYQYLKRIQRRYQKAGRKEKSELLTEMETHTGLHRKTLTRLMNGDLARKPRAQERGPRYGPEVDAALRLIWEALDYVCPARLTPQLAVTAKRLATHGELDLPPSLLEDLATISISSVRRHLPPQPLVERNRRRPSPPNQLQRRIPAYRIPRDIGEPGHLEIDLVHHGGSQPHGEFTYTLQCVDVATSWCGRRAILGRSYIVMADALHYLFQSWPVSIRQAHPDNGSEFLNHHLLRFLESAYPDVKLSRSRPGCPNDNRLVEQKNATGVRRYLGDRRFDTVQQTRFLNRIYERLDRYANFFLPVMHQIDKFWVPAADGHGGYLRRKHDDATPPLDRLLALKVLDPQLADELRAERDALNLLQERRLFLADLDHLFSYSNAAPGQTENAFETLTDPDLFPEARAVLAAGDTGDKGNPTFAPCAPSSTATTN